MNRIGSLRCGACRLAVVAGLTLLAAPPAPATLCPLAAAAEAKKAELEGRIESRLRVLQERIDRAYARKLRALEARAHEVERRWRLKEERLRRLERDASRELERRMREMRKRLERELERYPLV